MCQAFDSKGLKACKSNLMRKELIEEKALQRIKVTLSDLEVVEQVLNRIERKNKLEEDALRAFLSPFNKNHRRKLSNLEKIETDYFAGSIQPEVYSSRVELIKNDIAIIEKKIRKAERELEELQSRTIITKEAVYRALESFDELYEGASNQEKKLLIRAIIKKIKVLPNRKDIDYITFWFGYNDALLLIETGRTTS